MDGLNPTSTFPTFPRQTAIVQTPAAGKFLLSGSESDILAACAKLETLTESTSASPVLTTIPWGLSIEKVG